MQRSNLNEILVFMAAVDEGSFIAGRRAMGLTRSAAGKAVTRLEDRLGVRRLNRRTRTLSVTDAGRVFCERGAQILATVDDAEASVAGRAGMAGARRRRRVGQGAGPRLLEARQRRGPSRRRRFDVFWNRASGASSI
jgi:DNA-binding transcriptional LysR family regulator